ncbi:MAG TPA: TOMM precursor leader peptide-binding protein [Ktedonobacteraceae bacterium]|nr:TOMM precursor leader peptide-binding protein [Ktedonobacteraceae bacterium]
MQNSTVIRPKLKHTMAYMLSDEGLLFVEEDMCLRLKGKAVSRWFCHLGPYLDGKHTLEELCQGFDPSLRENIAKLVHRLIAKGVLKNAPPEEPGLVTETVYEQFHPQIELLDHLVDTPQQRFKKFRESCILLLGDGDAYLALGNSLLRNGLKHLFLALPPQIDLGEKEKYMQSFAARLKQLSQSGVEAAVSSIDYSQVSLPGGLRPYDIVVYCSENGSLKELFELNRRCLAEGVSFLPAYIFAGQVFIGPFVTPSAQAPCWLCAQMRLTAQSESAYGKLFWQSLALSDGPGSTEEWIPLPVTRILGNNLAFELFMQLSGAALPGSGSKITIQDIETLESSSEPLVQHPLCPVCSCYDEDADLRCLQAIVAGTYDRQMTTRELMEKMSLLIAPRAGLFSAFSDQNGEQVPLRYTTLGMGSPLFSQTGRHIPAYSTEDLQEARLSALLEGVRHYSMTLIDTRKVLFFSRAELTSKNRKPIAEHALTTWSGSRRPGDDERTKWLPAFSLSRQCLCVVPAGAVYSYGALNTQNSFEETLAGLAVGTHFQQIVTDGLLSALAYVHITELLRTQQAVIELLPDDLPTSDPALTFLLRSAERFASPFTILEVVHSSPMHLVIVSTQGDTRGENAVTYGYGLSGSDAVKMALYGLVAKLQAKHADSQLASDHVSMFPFAENVLWTDFTRHTTLSSRIWEPATTLEKLQASVHVCGYELIFVDITPSDIRSREALICGRVLLARQDA